eukprot:jgi/Psemu1/58091/gm1.58091_g
MSNILLNLLDTAASTSALTRTFISLITKLKCLSHSHRLTPHLTPSSPSPDDHVSNVDPEVELFNPTQQDFCHKIPRINDHATLDVPPSPFAVLIKHMPNAACIKTAPFLLFIGLLLSSNDAPSPSIPAASPPQSPTIPTTPHHMSKPSSSMISIPLLHLHQTNDAPSNSKEDINLAPTTVSVCNYINSAPGKYYLKTLFDSGSTDNLIVESSIPSRVTKYSLVQPIQMQTTNGRATCNHYVILENIMLPELSYSMRVLKIKCLLSPRIATTTSSLAEEP